MMNQTFNKIKIFFTLVILFFNSQSFAQQKINKDSIEVWAKYLLSKMTLEEKIGQMNQYNGFWDITGPAPKEGDAK